jgi:UDP-N-acetylglucosamine:LPS N-acetylglucosamine transferase
VAGRQQRILLVSSSGGVLLDMMALRPFWDRHDVHWVSVAAPDTNELLSGQRVEWVGELSPSQPVDLVRGIRRARAALAEQDIDLVISAGSGVAVPYFVAARLAGIPAWWVETLNVIGTPGLAARCCARLAQRVVVQHSHLLARHRRAINVGELY